MDEKEKPTEQVVIESVLVCLASALLLPSCLENRPVEGNGKWPEDARRVAIDQAERLVADLDSAGHIGALVEGLTT
jgi:hypothetical protein